MRIAFVGCGPSNVAAYIEMVNAVGEHLQSVEIFDPNGPMGSTAFNVQSDLLLTNTSAGVNSLLASNRLDFLSWLRDMHPRLNAGPACFVPRRLVRDYGLSRFEAARAYLTSLGCPTSVIPETVDGLLPADDLSTFLRVCGQMRGPFDVIILATGAGVCSPAGLDPARMLRPYPEAVVRGTFRQGGRALVLGSKLSAIDAALSILDAHERSQVTMASPSGRLPAVRSELLVHRAQRFSARRLVAQSDRSLLSAAERAALKDLKELRRSYRLSDASAHTQLQTDILDCEEDRISWQRSMGSFIDEANELWPHLSTVEQQTLYRRHRGFISRYISSFPLQNARMLEAAMRAGRLEVVRIEAPNRLQDCLARGGAGIGRFGHSGFDAIINATGTDSTAFARQPLYRNLSDKADLRNVHGGLRVDPVSMRLPIHHGAAVYAMGAPTTGSLLVTNYIRASVLQAYRLVRDVARTVQASDLDAAA